ncbi:MAG: site-specific DNA-methyltransferase [Zoogloeaceae bacterium]|jgi:adenine-specific DNA-methyltransferase|nr:site-specific DNA-methyltransferase [Zoogloeaceae bacterium]
MGTLKPRTASRAGEKNSECGMKNAMNKLKMQTKNLSDENFLKLAELFPNAVTETIDENGAVVRAIDKDVLAQEINAHVVEGREERYQFTWPDKRKSVLLANAPIAAALRPCREESVDFDATENLYIEGDNLDVLKLLRETYLNRVKMIYIDPPYNTGNDFVYEDNFAEETGEFLRRDGYYDTEGNRLRENRDSNGRFHTDWLNMIYPRLRVARDLLTEDGVIFISIDDNEVENLKKIANEIFGEERFAAQIPWRKRTAKSDVPFGVSQDYEWILVYAKSMEFVACLEGGTRKYFETEDFPDRPWRIHDLTKQTSASERPNSFFTIIDPKNGNEYPANPNRTWAITEETFKHYYAENRIVFPGDYDFLSISKPCLRYWKEDDIAKAGDRFGFIPVSTNLPSEIGMTQDGTKEIAELFKKKVFGFPKPVALIKYFLKAATAANPNNNDIILDFFSGSATTAHAVMQLNAEDGGKRNFIMVQLPEVCDEKSEAAKAGYSTICEIGKERIRRAGAKIKAELGMRNAELKNEQLSLADNSELDIGFRVLKLDSSNMKDVYYTPEEFLTAAEKQPDLFGFADNIKEGRTDEDLLFQVMLELGVPLSAKIAQDGGVYYVNDNYLIACFKEVDTALITEIAKQKPYYAVFRDSSFASDSALVNFEQVFNTYSPNTIRRVL